MSYNEKGAIFDSWLRNAGQNQVNNFEEISNELAESLREVVRISDRDHDAWARAKSALVRHKAMKGGA